MKNTLTTSLMVLCFMLTAVIGKAQDKFIGENYGDINTEMLGLHNNNINTSETGIAGQYQATFKVGAGFVYSFIFNKADNVCIAVREIMGKDLLESELNNLNKEYTKVDETHWISKDHRFKVNLDILPDGVTITHLKVK